MESSSIIIYHPKLTKPDRVVLQNLEADIEGCSNSEGFDFNEDGGGMKDESAQQNGSGMSACNLSAMLSFMAFYLSFFTKPLLGSEPTHFKLVLTYSLQLRRYSRSSRSG